MYYLVNIDLEETAGPFDSMEVVKAFSDKEEWVGDNIVILFIDRSGESSFNGYWRG